MEQEIMEITFEAATKFTQDTMHLLESKCGGPAGCYHLFVEAMEPNAARDLLARICQEAQLAGESVEEAAQRAIVGFLSIRLGSYQRAARMVH